MTTTFIDLVYGVPSEEATNNFFINQNPCNSVIEGLDYSGLAEDNDDEQQVYHVHEDYLTQDAKQLIKKFNHEYHITHFVELNSIEIKNNDSVLWVKPGLLLKLNDLGINTSNFRWLYVIEQW